MAAKVSLRTIVDEIDSVPEGWTAYLNRETGEVYSFSADDEATADIADSDEEFEPDQVRPVWEWDHRDQVRAILRSEDWVALPTRFDVDEWAIMERFAQSFEDEGLGRELTETIHGRGAFRHFKDTVHRHGIEQVWYDFKAAALAKIAMEWLDAHGVDYDRDDGKASSPKAPN